MSTVENPTTTVEAPVIQIADLQNAVQVIDYACEQGAFKGWKVIAQVSEVREKLVAFLNAANPPAAEPTEEAPAKSTTKKTPAKTAKKK